MGQQVSIQVHRIDNQDFVATGNEYTVRVLGIIEKEYDTDPYWKKCRECYVLFDGDEIFEVLLVTGHGPHDWDGRKRNSVRQLILRENVRTPRGCSLREIGWSNIDRYFPA